MDWYAHVTVAAVIEDGQRFLMIEENSEGRRVINQPAGHLEEDESLLDAVVREVLEETTRDFQADAVTGIYLYPSEENGTTYLRICFSGQVTGAHPELSLDEDIISAGWMTREEIEKRQAELRSPLVLKCIDDYLAGVRYPLDLISHVQGA